MVIFGASFALIAPSPIEPPAAEPGDLLAADLPAILAMFALQAGLLAWVAARLSGSAAAATAALFAIAFGSMSFMTQIESAFFVEAMSPADAARVALAGGVALTLFCPLTVWTMRAAREPFEAGPENLLPSTPGSWATRIAAVVAVYLSLYFLFGYYVAWVRPEVHLFYGGPAPTGFLDHMAGLLRDQPELFAFQVARAILWVAFALMVVRRFQGGRLANGIAVGAVFAWLMNGQLLLPNPYMPEPVRKIHLVETASSNFLFGMALVAILRRNPEGPTAQETRT